MNGLILIDPKQIKIFDSHRFTLLCNELLRTEAERLSIPQYLVDTTVSDTVPDGGIDCRVNRQDQGMDDSDRWIPQKTSAWQLKSGNCPSVSKLKETELIKPEVTAAISRGEAYCFVTADSIQSTKKLAIRSAIENCYRELNQHPNCRVLTATDLAQWAQEHLAIGVRHFRIPIEGWELFIQWEQATRFENRYFPDTARTEIIELIQNGIKRRERILRIIGRAGVGKTRVVLEALRAPGIQERVLYLPDASRFNSNFFWYLKQENRNGSGILVIDECTTELYSLIRNRAEALPSGFITIAISPLEYQSRSHTKALEIGALDIEKLAQILETFIPTLSEFERRAIAMRCGGSPKLAVLLGEIIGQDRGERRGWEHYEEDINVIEYLNHRVFPVNTIDPESRLMRGLSLFTRIGWWDEVADEGKIVAEFIGVDWTIAPNVADRLIQRGVISPRGRFLYPTPDVLANYLTRDTIRSYGATKIKNLFNSLPGEAQSALVERLRQLGEAPEVRSVITYILGERGFFRNLADLNELSTTHLLRELISAYPELIAHRLDQVIGTASHEELLQFGPGRRDVVWTLEELAWWRDYFPIAARSLLRLAWGENENIANNATGIWQQLFQVVLGGTAAPYHERIPILRDALNSDDPTIRQLGILGLSSMLQTEHIMRIGAPPEGTGRLPPLEWKPTTFAEWSDIIRQGLEFLAITLDDPSVEVRKKTIEVLESRGQELISAGFLDEWTSLARKLVGEPFEVRNRILRVISDTLQYTQNLEEPKKIILRELEKLLRGISFSDRLRRVVGSWDYELERDETHKVEDLLQELALEVLTTPEAFELELSWLMSGNANSAYRFGKQLGWLDEQEDMMNSIIHYWHSEIPDDRFVSGYLAGVTERRGINWLEDQLDQWARDSQKALLVANTTWRIIPSDRSARRLQLLIETDLLPGSFLGNLAAGFWARDISTEVLHDLIKAASKDKSLAAISGRLAVLDQYIEKYGNQMPILQSLIYQALEEGTGLTLTVMDSFHWKRLAERVSEDNPLLVARLCVMAATGEHHHRSNDIREVLQQVIVSGGWQVFEQIVGPAIIENPLLLWRLDSPFAGRNLLSSLDAKDLVAWIEKDVETRLHLIAHAVPIGDQPLSNLARALLVRWGDRDDVRSALAATFGSGHWSGPEGNWLAQKLKQIEGWMTDPNPNVRAWAIELADYYRRRIERAKLLEEEER